MPARGLVFCRRGRWLDRLMFLCWLYRQSLGGLLDLLLDTLLLDVRQGKMVLEIRQPDRFAASSAVLEGSCR